MRVFLRSVILAAVFTFILEATILTTASRIAWLFLYPAIRGTAFLLGSHIGSSESGLNNLLELAIASSVLNVVLYALLFFAGSNFLLRLRKIGSESRLERHGLGRIQPTTND
jgi:hypothetical protein